MMPADQADRGRLPALLALALGDREADPAAGLDGIELALDHAVAMKVDLALCGLDEAEAALAVDHAHRAVRRHLVRVHLAAAPARMVLELAHRSLKASRIATWTSSCAWSLGPVCVPASSLPDAPISIRTRNRLPRW
jgi:hypothetical protein